jgi:hypothetical protein
MKNIDVMITDQYLKINAPSIKYFAGVDFPLDIDFDNAKNKV